MRKFMFIAAILAASLCFGGCPSKDHEVPDPEPEFSLESYNGHFVQALSKAYEEFLETDEMPSSVNVEGLSYSKSQYVAAACILLERMVSNPSGWQGGEIDLPERCVGSSEYRWNTYAPDEISFEDVKWLAATNLSYMKEHSGVFPNYVTFPTKCTIVVTEHSNQIYYNATAVILARVMNAYVGSKGKWPEAVSSWESDFLRKTTNCDTDSPVVLAARDAALSGLGSGATQRQKAEAIFAYARDEWEWENYNNTRKGSVTTVQEKGGNCCDLTHATLAMCRASGIPARYLHGQCYFSSGVIGHVIPEIYVDGQWWICDPSNNSATFGTPTWKGMETFNGRYKTLSF